MTPSISEAEWQVMSVLWDVHPASANQIVSRLADRTDWNPKTVKTLISRLVKKKALGFEKQGRCHLYFPLVDRADIVKTESRSFLNRFFNGAVTPMLACLMDNEDVSPAEIRELRQMLDQAFETEDRDDT